MIEWKVYGDTRETQPPSHEFYLVTDGKTVKFAQHYHDLTYGYSWWDVSGYMVAPVTHYAKVNLP